MSGRLFRFLAICCTLVFLAAAPGEAASAEEIVVSAAASLTTVLEEVGRTFEEIRPGTRIVFNFAASGTLLQQIDKGAPVDVFAPADQETMNKAAAKGLIVPGSRKNFARNRLVLAVPARSTSAIAGLKDLGRAGVQRIGIGDPAFVPAGRYAKQSILAAGLWSVLEAKLIPGNSVRQILDYLSRGEIDAGFVYATDAAAAREKVRLVEELGGHDPVLYPMAMVAASGRKDLAREFLEFTLGTKARAIFSKHGFGVP